MVEMLGWWCVLMVASVLFVWPLVQALAARPSRAEWRRRCDEQAAEAERWVRLEGKGAGA